MKKIKLILFVGIALCLVTGCKTVDKNKEAEKLNDLIPNSQIIIIENAGHTFGSNHPFQFNELPSDLVKVVGESILFL